MYCYKLPGSLRCRGCEKTDSAECTKDLAGAQPYKYRRVHRDLRRPSNPLTSTNDRDEALPQDKDGLDWSSDSEEETSEYEDIGLRALRLYLKSLPPSRFPQYQSKMPCRRCLQERTSRNMLPDQMGKCRRCYCDRNRQCKPAPYGAKPYPRKYPELEDLLSTRKSPQPSAPTLDQSFLAAYESTDSEDVDDDRFEDEVLGHFDHKNDCALKLLRLYLQNPPRSNKVIDAKLRRRIPYRRCLVQRKDCYFTEGSAVKCRVCMVARKIGCSSNLCGAKPYERSWRKHLDGSSTVTRDRRHSRPVQHASSSDEVHSDHNASEHSEMARSLPERDRERLFGADKHDTGLVLLRNYMSRPPNKTGSAIPCRRCLRFRIACHGSKEASSDCEQCATQCVRCHPDLKAALPYTNRYRHLTADEALYLRRYAKTNLEILNLEDSDNHESDGGGSSIQADETNILALFDYDPTDPGFGTLKDYINNSPGTNEHILSQGFHVAEYPCGTYLTLRVACYTRGNEVRCRRCQVNKGSRSCNKDLRGAVLGPVVAAMYAKRRMRQAYQRLVVPEAAEQTIPVTEIDDDSEDSLLSISDDQSARQTDRVWMHDPRTPSINNFSWSELLATVNGDANDVGFKTLQAYLTAPPRTQDLVEVNRLTFRGCLNQHITCVKTSDPAKCRKCTKMRFQNCNFNLKSAGAGPGKWTSVAGQEALAKFR